MSKVDPVIQLCAALFAQFEAHSLFPYYFRFVDLEQDGPYAIFHAFSELFEALLRGKETDAVLLTDLIAFLNEGIAQGDPEIENVIKCEVFAPLNQREIDFLEGKLSPKAHQMLARLYD